MTNTTDRITPATVERDTRTPRRVRDNGRPTDPDGMRREIQRTRHRLSTTLDELEERIVKERRELERRKEDLWDKATLKGFRRTLSREPWRSVAIAFAVGYVIAAIRD